MTRRSATRPTAARVVAARVARALAAFVVVAVPMLAAPALAARTAASAPPMLQPVTVMQRQPQYDVVVELQPAPVSPMPHDAAYITPASAVTTAPSPGGTGRPSNAAGGGGATPTPTNSSPRIDATVAPVLDLNSASTPLALVVDASSSGARSLPQALSGAAGVVLQLPNMNPVTVVADHDPPKLLTEADDTAAQAINALASINASGTRATTAALGQAIDRLHEVQLRVPRSGAQPNRAHLGLVILTTSGPAPKGAEASSLVQRLQQSNLVLGVVTTGSTSTGWGDVATRTGGLAVVANPTDASEGYDSLLHALQARYVVTFTTPEPLGTAFVTVTSAGLPYTGRVDMPPPGSPGAAPGASSASGTTGSAPGSALTGATRIWVGLAILLVLAAIGAVILALRLRRRRPAAAPQPPPEPVAAPADPAPSDDAPVPPGVRMFDVSNPGAPTELDPAKLAAGSAASAAPPPEQAYRGRHREPGVIDVLDDDDDGDEHLDARPGRQGEPEPKETGRDGDAGDRRDDGSKVGDRDPREDHGEGNGERKTIAEGNGVRSVKEAG
jgi:hypothetical protein